MTFAASIAELIPRSVRRVTLPVALFTTCLWGGACLPSPGPSTLEEAAGRVLDEDTGEGIPDAEVIEWYRGAGATPGRRKELHARWTRSDAAGRFAFPRERSPSLRMWVGKTYGPTYSFYHPSYGLEHGGRGGGREVQLRGSLRRSAERLRELAPFCRGLRDDPGARRLAELACPLSAHARYPDGGPRTEGPTDERGRRTGTWTFYYENGAVAARGDYRAGGAAGSWRFFRRDGRPVAER